MSYPRFQRARALKVLKYGSGNFTLTTTWTFLAGMELALEAQVGDVIEVALSALVGSEAAEAHFDVATTVAGAAVNYFSKAGTTPGGNGFVGWYRSSSGGFGPSAGSAFITLVSGDISSGLVTLRLWGQSNTGTKTAYASGDNLLAMTVKNLGPVDPH